MRLLSAVLLVTVSLFACRKEKPLPAAVDAGSNTVLVLNEGNYMWANASLDLFNIDSGTLRSDVFKTINQKPLGDVLQSGSIINGDVWLVVNNSGKILVLDSQTLKEKYSITGLGSPRYAVKAGSHIWVSDLYSRKIQVRDATGKQLFKQIHTGAWTEQMVFSGSHVWVACYDGWLRKYHAADFNIIDSCYVGKGLRWIVSDKKNNIWALASYNDSAYSRLQQWTPDGKRLKSFTMPLSGYASSLCMNPGKDSLYYLATGVYSLSIEDVQLPVKPVFTITGANLYNIACHPRKNVLFISDAADYVSRGKIYIVGSAGNEIGSLTAGIIPSGFVFY